MVPVQFILGENILSRPVIVPACQQESVSDFTTDTLKNNVTYGEAVQYQQVPFMIFQWFKSNLPD